MIETDLQTLFVFPLRFDKKKLTKTMNSEMKIDHKSHCGDSSKVKFPIYCQKAHMDFASN